MDFISGGNRNQITLLPDSVEGYVNENSPVRVIEAYINSLNLSSLGFTKPKPNNTGRPMYDPKDLLKLYIYGYMNKVRSSRRLEIETKRNLEVIWLLRRLSPDHKTISRFRHDNSAALKNVFRDFVKLCMKLDLYGKELVAVDGSKFKAVNSKDRNFTDKKLQERIARIDARIEEYLRELEESDGKEDAVGGEKSAEEVAKIITELTERKEVYQAYAEELSQTGGSQKSLTDPDSRLMKANGKMEVCYNVQTAVDEKNKLIAEFDVTNSATDINQLSVMANEAAEILENPKLTAVADKGYDSASDIVKCLRSGKDAHVCGGEMDVCIPADELGKDITSYTNGRTIYIPERNIALCPMGKVLYPSYYMKKKNKAAFANFKVCSGCPRRCTKGKEVRFEINMPKERFSKAFDDSNLYIKQIHIKPDPKLVKMRKSIVEHPFGTIKRNMDAGYCLTRGVKNVSGEFSLAFLAYNLKRIINMMGTKKLIECIGT